MNYELMAKREKSVDNLHGLGKKRPAGRGWGARLWLLMLAAMMLWGWGGGAGAQDTATIPSVSAQLAAELVRYFPAVTGEVIKVDGRRIYVDIGVKDEVWPGLSLDVFRQGEALKHPSTGAVIGHDERSLGQITLVRLSENHSVGVYIQTEEGAVVQPGDKVRLTSGRIHVSLLPPDGSAPANVSSTELSAQLRSDLEATGRFRVEGAERVNAWLLERGVTAESAAQSPYLQRLTKSLKTPYVVQPVLKSAQGQSILALRLLAATQDEPVAEASAVLTGETAAAVAAAPPVGKTAPAPVPTPAPTSSEKFGGLFRQPLQPPLGGAPWNLAEGMTELHRFSEELVGFDAGDPDGDGRVEVVVATTSRISLYQLNERNLQLIDAFKAGKQGRFISAQLVQLGSSSPLGIVVNHQGDTDSIDSFVLVLQGQQLAYWQRHIDETLLAVDSDGDGINDRVWGQPFDQTLLFARDRVREYTPGSRKLKFQNNLRVPYPFRATGAALVQLDAGAEVGRDLIFVDENNRLRIYRGKEKLWQSADFVGGSYAEAQLGQGGEVDILIGKIIKNSFRFEAIPEAVDFDGDGVDEVLVIRNGSSLGGIVPNRTRFASGDVALLRAGPYGYSLSPVSPKFDGMVSGLSVVPNPVPGVLIAVSKRQGVLGRKKQTIIFLSRLPLG